MKAVAVQTENGSRIIVNPMQVKTIHATKDKDCCALDMGGPTIRIRMAPMDLAELLGWEVPAADSGALTARKGSEEKSEQPAKKSVKAAPKKGKVKTAKAKIASKSGMSG